MRAPDDFGKDFLLLLGEVRGEGASAFSDLGFAFAVDKFGVFEIRILDLIQDRKLLGRL